LTFPVACLRKICIETDRSGRIAFLFNIQLYNKELIVICVPRAAVELDMNTVIHDYTCDVTINLLPLRE